MTGTVETEWGYPRTVLRENPRTGTVGILVIAAGTQYEIAVRDARSFIKWAERGGDVDRTWARGIVYHHTAGGVAAKRTARAELGLLIEMARSSQWGLPYNFVVMPAPPFRIWYLNDVDGCWPHTLHANCLTAIAAYGNYSVAKPDARMVGRMVGLADALATMWQAWVQEHQHRDFTPTECPGTNLAPLLPSLAHQRDFPLP